MNINLVKTKQSKGLRGLSGLIEFDERGYRKNYVIDIYTLGKNMSLKKVNFDFLKFE